MNAIVKTTNRLRNAPVMGSTVVLFSDMTRVKLAHDSYSNPILPQAFPLTAQELRAVREVSLRELNELARGVSAGSVESDYDYNRRIEAERAAQREQDATTRIAAEQEAARLASLATDRQINYLISLGVTNAANMNLSKNDASWMIDNVKSQRTQGHDINPWTIVE